MTTAENVFPKVPGDPLFADEANYHVGTFIRAKVGENISGGMLCYIRKDDNTAYVSDVGTPNDIRANGIVFSDIASGGTALIQTRGRRFYNSLIVGSTYYIGSVGSISPVPNGVQVGRLIQGSEFYIDIVQDDRDSVGIIKAYHNTMSGLPLNNLTAFWVQCNGQTLSDTESPLNGKVIPNLTGSATTPTTKRFLRGALLAGSTGGTDTHAHDIQQVEGTGSTGQQSNLNKTSTTDNFSTLPSYFEITWLMKIK